MKNEIRLDIKWDLDGGIETDLALFEELGATVGRHWGPYIAMTCSPGESPQRHEEPASATLYFEDAERATSFLKALDSRLVWAHWMENNDPASAHTVIRPERTAWGYSPSSGWPTR